MTTAPDGTILLYTSHPNEPFIDKLSDAGQTLVTGGKYRHVAYFAGGYTWESTIWHEDGVLIQRSGPRQTFGLKDDADLYRVPIRMLTPQEAQGLVMYAYVQIWTGKKYNIPELLADAFIYPTRGFWEKLGHVPFGSNAHGGVCSAFTAKAFVLGALIPVWKDVQLADRTPNDFATHDFWRDAA